MIDVLITSLCLQLNNMPETSKYYTSCVNSIQAASIQYKVKPTIDGLEQRFNNDMKKRTGEAVWWFVGMGYAYEQKGTINFNVSAKPYVDNINISGNPNGTANINFIWSW